MEEVNSKNKRRTRLRKNILDDFRLYNYNAKWTRETIESPERQEARSRWHAAGAYGLAAGGQAAECQSSTAVSIGKFSSYCQLSARYLSIGINKIRLT